MRASSGMILLPGRYVRFYLSCGMLNMEQTMAFPSPTHGYFYQEGMSEGITLVGQEGITLMG